MVSELQNLTERVRAKLHNMEVIEKCMFGGITFMLNGNMLCCAKNKGMMVRVGKEALLLPHACPCDCTEARLRHDRSRGVAP